MFQGDSLCAVTPASSGAAVPPCTAHPEGIALAGTAFWYLFFLLTAAENEGLQQLSNFEVTCG